MKLRDRDQDDDLTQVHEPVRADTSAASAAGTSVHEHEGLPEVADFACPSCGAGMDAGQDWCLECGTAAPGRLGARPGWRAALTVTSATVVLVLGAVVAAYAAMSTDATRDTRDGQINGAPIQAEAPPPPAPPSATTTPPATGEEPSVPAPEAGSSDSEAEPVPGGGGGGAPAFGDGGGGGGGVAPSGGGGGAPAPGGGGGGGAPAPGGGGGGGSPAPAAPPVGLIALAPGAGSIYDPSDRSGARFSDPTAAYDGSDARGFTMSAPDDGDPFGAGIAFRLDKPRDLRSLEIATETEGFTVEVYGSAGETRPPAILDDRWVDLGRRTDVQDGTRISLNSDEVNRVRHVAVWIAGVPRGTGAEEGSSRRTVNLNELRFRGR
jgi:hypothetical protein